MKSHPTIIEQITTRTRCQMVDVTPRLRDAIASLGVREGMILIQSPHTTAGVTINENADPDVQKDLLGKLAQLVPHKEAFYEHVEGNSDAHVKTSLTGNLLTVIIEHGDLALGTWQGVYFCEFDGPRQRQLWLKLVEFEGSPPPRQTA
jgi:secondary thiamine-phosphate synthase enzyme